MTVYERDRMPIEEENKHARRGCVLAIFIVPVICFVLLWPLVTFTASGQRVLAHTVLYTLSTGVPLPIPYARGLANTAAAGCELDQANPKPANYQTQQDNLTAEYESMISAYNRYYAVLQRNDGIITMYDPPDEIPGNYASAKLFFCRN